MGGMIQFCLLLLLLATGSGDDGCGTSGTFGWWYQWRCGDICVDVASPCQCGDTRIEMTDDRWCCGSGCTWDGDDNSPGICPNTSTPLYLNQSCHGNCNYSPYDQYRNSQHVRSHVPVDCGDQTACIAEQRCQAGQVGTCDQDNRIPALCTGAPPACPDYSDIKYCADHTTDMTNTLGNRTCDMVHVGAIYGLLFSKSCHTGPCIRPTDYNNKRYDCPRREDETVTATNNTDDAGHITLPTVCTTEYGGPGLMCEEECIHMWSWCGTDSLAGTCEVDGICNNQTFWREMDSKHRQRA